MPMTTFDEYESYKNKYISLANDLSGCFDDSLRNAGAQDSVIFDAKKALAICKDFMLPSVRGNDIEIIL